MNKKESPKNRKIKFLPPTLYGSPILDPKTPIPEWNEFRYDPEFREGFIHEISARLTKTQGIIFEQMVLEKGQLVLNNRLEAEFQIYLESRKTMIKKMRQLFHPYGDHIENLPTYGYRLVSCSGQK